MFVMSRLRFPIAFIVALALAALLALAAFSYTVEAQQDDAAGEQTDTAATDGPVTIENHSWKKYHWRRTENPLKLNLGNNLNSTWYPLLVKASNAWETVPSTLSWPDVLDTEIVEGGARPKSCKPTARQVEVCNAKYGKNGWLGLAQIWVGSGDHITSGVAKMNDSYSMSAAQKQQVMCHEIGHTFGLGHQDENFDNANLGTCLDYTRDATDSQTPNSHDYEQLAIIYDPQSGGHLDPSGSTASRLPAAAKGNYNSRAEWGALRHRSKDGKHEVYERDFSDGTKMVTFVDKADQEGQTQQQERTQDKAKKQEEEDQ